MKKVFFLLIAALFLFSSQIMALSSLPDLPDPTAYTGPIPNAIQYGDFYSYSLPLLHYFDEPNDNNFNSGDSWYVGKPGPNDDVIVLYTNASNVDEINPVGTGDVPIMDQAYAAQDLGSSNDSSGNFYMTQAADPSYPASDPAAVEFAGDTATYWDSQLDAMIDYLGGSQMVFMFNNNQIDSLDENGYPGQNLFGFGQAMIVDDDGILDTLYFDFLNSNTGNDVYSYQNTFGSAPLDTTSSDGFFNPYVDYMNPGSFVLSGGSLCADAAGVYFEGTADYNACLDGGGTQLDHNLGFPTAAYALYSPELNNGLEGWLAQGYDTISIDMRLEHLNNGPEQLFIMRVGDDEYTPVPEPSSLALLGGGLLGLGIYAGRRKK